ncbi:hypothetical protein NLI96_g5229 [Meripilus lineatus]|uniref:Cytochrome P450 n=1 Tax=Meripilus lineatus TaxID=2056292 RepID=A0AAD5V3C8_9APHY|nr:hypothetical protein NLI96_g5229 [Physisporinus lineatus]
MIGLLEALDVVFGTFFVVVVYRLLTTRRQGPLPPGPKGLPIIGNVLDMPTSHEWLTFAKWGVQWGDIVSVNLLGQPMVILNSAEIASELLEKRSAIYSDRPTLVMSGEMVGWKNALGLVRYNDKFREYRKFISRKMGTRSQVQEFYELQEVETHTFTRRVLKEPENLAAHIRRTAGAIILKISYGYTVKDGTDPLVDLVDHAMDQFSEFTRPGAFLVDVLPVLRHFPSWFPGAGFKAKVPAWAKTMNDMADVPLEFVKDQMQRGTNVPNFTSDLLESENISPEREFNIKWAAASLYAGKNSIPVLCSIVLCLISPLTQRRAALTGGADTTVSAIYSFYYAMMAYPEVQQRAQEEIDQIVGGERLPRVEDRENLPYVDALVKEVFRFHPIAPLGLPHRLTHDDEFQGYHLPKDTILIANIWKFLHDPDVYPNPSVFDPTRFLRSDGHTPQRDPRDLAFGFGRRICPGMNLADTSVFISCAMSLAVFDIRKPVENGRVIEPVYGALSGTVSHPLPFQCDIKPRGAKAEALVLSAE